MSMHNILATSYDAITDTQYWGSGLLFKVAHYQYWLILAIGDQFVYPSILIFGTDVEPHVCTPLVVLRQEIMSIPVRWCPERCGKETRLTHR
jgi:hypothetical protein